VYRGGNPQAALGENMSRFVKEGDRGLKGEEKNNWRRRKKEIGVSSKKSLQKVGCLSP